MPFELNLDPKRVAAYLSDQGWLERGERVSTADHAGDGNMNRTVRVRSDRRSFILKQSQAYCVNFPEIPAPVERIEVEVAFYAIARRSEALAARMPEVLAFDRENHIALIEDLGKGSDLTSLYAGEQLSPEELNTLCSLARELHGIPLSAAEQKALRNAAMRELNHEHIFDIPLRDDNDLDIDAVTPGLGALAQILKDDDDYVGRVIALGMLYTTADGPALLHGDYYPGSFLRTPRGLAIIDPEFAFPGPAEFDLGVLAAHLSFAGSEENIVERIAAGYAGPLDLTLLRGFAGTEIMRRLLGISQLPLVASLERKRKWLDRSRRWVVGSG